MGLPTRRSTGFALPRWFTTSASCERRAELLNRPGPLTDAEFDVIRLHPVDGAEMTAGWPTHELTAIVRHHHERVDGTGYPDHLRATAIPLGARIIAVADTFDAVTSTRPTGARRGTAERSRSSTMAGSQLDAAAVRVFVGYYSGNRLAVAGRSRAPR